jgi:beta-mannosidase
MYNDCWPETGWTIIDYYLTRKISYYFLKRAFANTMFIIRGEGNTMHVVGINETPNDMEGNVQYGYISFDGANCKVETAAIRMPAFTRNTVLSFDCTDDPRSGTCFVKPVEDNEVILPAVSLRSYFRDYTFSEPSARITEILRENGITKVVIKAENFIPFVYLDLEDDIKLSDNYFSMLPGEERTIDIYRILEDEDIQLKFAYTMPN